MKLPQWMLLFVASLVAVGGTQAQIVSKKALTLEGAKQVVATAVAEAKRLNAPGGAFAVVDDGGNLLYLERLDNTFAAGGNISIGKARTAAIFKKPTSFFEKIIREGRTPMVALNDFTPLQGGVPIEVDGQIVGAIGVSGAASAQQDDDLAVAGAGAFKSMGAGEMPMKEEVTYLTGNIVAEAFKKGAPLVEEANYKVHASHRDGAGMAEVHTKDTDIIYVLEGSAKFVTGGTVVDPKTIAPDEIRGSSITNGKLGTLSKGDVVIVPNGTPHWFKEVPGTFNYYVVKVTEKRS